MPSQLILTLRALATMTLITAITWMVIRPGFDALITLLTSISGLLALVATDKSKTSSSNESSIAHPESIHANQQSSSSPPPSPYFVQPTPITPDPEKPSNLIQDAGLLMYAVTAIVGGIIGFIAGVPDGAISGVTKAGLGVIGGLIVSAGIAWIIEITVELIGFLWITRWFWLIVGIVVALGYLISGKM